MNGVTIYKSSNRISDERLERLGKYFIYHDIEQRYNISFERFVHMVQIGTWAQFVK